MKFYEKKWYLTCFRYTKFVLIRALALLLLFSASSTYANGTYNPVTLRPIQDISISGRVTDGKNSPIPGSSVKVKGTAKGTVTDKDGHFTLSVPEGTTTLVVSYMGFETQEVQLNGKKNINITLKEENNDLNEVVVVGYGTQKKATLTGAVSQIKGDVVKLSPNGNLSNNLTGRTTGLIAVNRSGEPGNDGSALSIRGSASYANPNATPLTIIDGVPDRSFSRINPEDIESISILKDASAAIYGVRAANGVILITTKRGKTGKPVLSYTGSYSLQSVTRRPDMVNAAQYATYFNELNTRLGQPKLYSDNDIKLYADGSDPLGHPSTDWYDAVVAKTAPMTQHELNISGGSENVKYFMSGQYSKQDYLFKDSPFNFGQKNIRANIDANVTKDLKISLDLAGRNEDKYSPLDNSNQNGGIFMAILGQYPTLPAKYPNGLPGSGNTAGSNPLLRAGDAPGYDRRLSYFVQTTGTIDLKMPWITQGLYATAYAGLDNTFWQYKNLSRPYDAYQYDPSTQKYVNFKDQTSGNMVNLREDWGRWRRNTYNVKLGYDRIFNDVHSVNAIVGYESSDYFYNAVYAARKGLLSDQLPYLSLASSDPANISNGGSGDQNGRESIYGRANYGFKEKYLFEFSFRYNGSYNFAPGRKYGFFPGISAGWVLSKENFFTKALPFVDFAKIRGSWGILGDDDIGAFKFLSLYNVVDPGYFLGTDGTPVVGLSTNVSPNPLATWEKVKTTDIGLELGFLKNRLTLNADYFLRNRYDILSARNASVPNYTGLSGKLPPENIGKSNSNGFEIELNYNGKIGNDFTYNVGGNFTHTKSKIVFSDESPNVPDYQKQTGYPIRSYLLYKTDGVYNNQAEIDNDKNAKGNKVTPLTGTKPGDIKYIDVNNDGKITSTDRVRFFDSPLPNNVFGITLGANYKGFGLNVLFYGQSGVKQLIRPQGTNSAFTPPLWQYEGRWTPQTPDNNMPAAFDRTSTVNNIDSDYWLNDASFLKLKTVELSYQLPASFISKLKVHSARVFVNGSNLFILSKLKNYDPELNYVPADNNGYYVNGAYYPQTRIIGAGLNVSF
ncbi:TonB-dependent receptor [Pedobacter nutrimenti]|uniref:SusC/RagA family TonB-linked outer membrane protein n=1 Tax=Pedobacter nutrimenti TaxID=1241337 RepID=UPI00293019A8|nr:TonB-dependent receptor [Pedobacter nutrimenti]